MSKKRRLVIKDSFGNASSNEKLTHKKSNKNNGAAAVRKSKAQPGADGI